MTVVIVKHDGADGHDGAAAMVDGNICDVELSRGRCDLETSPVEVLPVDEVEQDVGELHAEEEQGSDCLLTRPLGASIWIIV